MKWSFSWKNEKTRFFTLSDGTIILPKYISNTEEQKIHEQHHVHENITYKTIFQTKKICLCQS